MNTKGVKTADGAFDACTTWNVRWTYDYQESRGFCLLRNIRTTADTVIHFPRWNAGPKATPDLKRQWEKYTVALRQHEEGHKQHAIKAAQEIEKTLLTLGSRRNCNALDTDANAIGKKIIDRYDQKDVQYDEKTQHGRTQGATFPKNYLLKKKPLKLKHAKPRRDIIQS